MFLLTFSCLKYFCYPRYFNFNSMYPSLNISLYFYQTSSVINAHFFMISISLSFASVSSILYLTKYNFINFFYKNATLIYCFLMNLPSILNDLLILSPEIMIIFNLIAIIKDHQMFSLTFCLLNVIFKTRFDFF